MAWEPMPTMLIESASILKTKGGWMTRIDDPFGSQFRVNIPYGLTPNGFEIPEPPSSKKAITQRFLDMHLEALEDEFFDLGKVSAAREVVRNFFEKKSRYNQHAHSYRLKHVVERFWKRNELHEHAYISNGDCIWALSLEEFLCKRVDDSLNGIFQISDASIGLLDKNNFFTGRSRFVPHASVADGLYGFVDRRENQN